MSVTVLGPRGTCEGARGVGYHPESAVSLLNVSVQALQQSGVWTIWCGDSGSARLHWLCGSDSPVANTIVASSNMISLQPILSDTKYKILPGVTENFPGWFLHIFNFERSSCHIRSIMRLTFVSFAFLFFINVLATPINPSRGSTVALRVSCWIINPSILNCLHHQRRSPNEHGGHGKVSAPKAVLVVLPSEYSS